MNKKIQSQTENLNKEHKKQNRRHKLLTVLAAVVVFCTTYALILPAITWERQLLCELDEHTHSASCYEEVTVPAVMELTCTREEHTHTSNCYLMNGDLNCDLAEHIHGADCFVAVPEHVETRLTCGKEEHTHCDACFDAMPAPATAVFCSQVEHTHTADCYFENGDLKCTLTEHVHSAECGCNKNADLETAAVWEASFADVALYGDEATRVILLAESQLGYRASETNFIVTEDGATKPYTRYGAYCGNPYGDWCAMFCTFCIDYAKIENFPTAAECDRWIERLSEQDLYRAAGEYEPKSGDLIFFDWDANGSADHVGFVYQVTADKLVTIEGNCNSSVCTQDYAPDDATILGYGVMPGETRRSLKKDEEPIGEGAPAVPEMISADPAANDWQVAYGRFTGNSADAQIVRDANGNEFRLRKQLVPTGVENEFYVYLNAEPVFVHDWVAIFKESGVVINNANNSGSALYDSEYGFDPTTGIAEIKANINYNSNSSMLVDLDNYPLTDFYADKTTKQFYIDTIMLNTGETGSDGKPVYVTITGCHLVYAIPQQSGSSFTIFYSPANSDSTYKLSQISMLSGAPNGIISNCSNADEVVAKIEPGTLVFPAEAYKVLLEANMNKFDHVLQRSFAESITDPMGDNIILVNPEDPVVYCSTGKETVTFTGNTLFWDLSAFSEIINPSDNPAAYEQIGTDDAFTAKNYYQLVYKIRLDVEADDFNSCADAMTATTGDTVYPTNGETLLSYHSCTYSYADDVLVHTESEDLTQGFNVPAVRGLLYDIAFRKVDEDGKPLPGAVFRLYQDNVQIGEAITTDDSGSTYRFTDLPWGSYTLVETPPEGYTADKLTNALAMSFTLDRDHMVSDTTEYPQNMRYSPDGSADIWTIVNKEGITRLDLIKTDEDGDPLAGAEFKLYSDKELTNELNVGLIPSGEDGVFTPAGFEIQQGTYYLVETKAPEGYYPLKEAATLVVDGNGVRVITNKQFDATQSEDGVYSLAIINYSGAVLPSTGGIGTAPFYTIGAAFLLSAAAYVLAVKRKRESV